jgi:thiol-disulfide isomerase/thioredoxin
MRYPSFARALALGVFVTAGCAKQTPSAPTAAAPAAAAAAAPTALATKAPEPIHISHGQEIKLTDYLVPGKTTIFDFYSEFCPPCRALSPKLEKLHQDRADIAVVKVDINRPGIHGIDWQSPVAHEFGLQSIPHLTVYGPDGAVKADGDAAYDLVLGWIGG